MAQKPRLRLLERRQRLNEIIKLARAEIAEIDSELSPEEAKHKIVYGRQFFWDYVYPLFEEEENSLSTRRMRELLRGRGIETESAPFRLFLNRRKADGFLDMDRLIGGAGLWHLADLAKHERSAFKRKQRRS